MKQNTLILLAAVAFALYLRSKLLAPSVPDPVAAKVSLGVRG